MYVLEPHPNDFRLLLSASHDGLIILWDLTIGKSIKQFNNNVSVHLNQIFFSTFFLLTFAKLGLGIREIL